MQHSSRAYLQTQANGYVCAHVSFNISYLKDKSIPVVSYFYTFLLQEIVWNHREEMKNHTRHRVYPSGTDRWFPVTHPNFFGSASKLHVEQDWKLNHHCPHSVGFPSQDPNMFLPP